METGRPEEITVIVYRGRNLHGKKQGRGKFHVVFSVGGNKFKSEVVDDPSGQPEWNNEAEIPVDNPQDPLILKVKEKDDIIGQVVIPLAELPTSRSDRQRCMALQPHKKCQNPQGDIVISAWISRKGLPQNTSDEGLTKPKSSMLKKMKADQTLQKQAGLTGSQLSLASNASEKKTSVMKKLKGALSHSPKLGGRKLSSKSTSMMNLGPQQSLSLADPNLHLSNESLNSQTSATSEKKKLSAVEKLKHKLGKSPMDRRKDMNKSNSRSCSNLAVLDPEMKLSDVHSSNESLKSSKSNKSAGKPFKGLFSKRGPKSEKPIPAQFDLSRPSSHLLQEMSKETEMFGAVPFNAQEEGSTPINSSPNSNSNSPSQKHHTLPRTTVDDSPFQRRQNSLSTRKRPDLSHRSPAVIHRSPPMAKHEPVKVTTSDSSSPPQPSSGKRNVFTINADINEEFESGSWPNFDSSQDRKQSVVELEKKVPANEEPKANPQTEEKPTESTNPFNESANPFDESTNPFDEIDDAQPQSQPVTIAIESKPLIHVQQPSNDSSMVLDTPSQKKKIMAPFVFSPSDDEDDVKHIPEISGVSPREGSTEGGTQVTIRGDYLGKSKSDVIALSVCGVDCLRSLEYYSEYKISCVTGTRKPGSGKIVIETKSGGLARSTIDYIFIQPRPVQEENAPKATATVQSMQKMAEASPVQKKKAPPPPQPKETIGSHQGRGDGNDPKTAVVEPISRAKMTHSRTDSGDLKRKVPPVQSINNRQVSGVDIDDVSYNKDELLRLISTLQSENKKLKDESQSMRAYIDQLVMRVLDKCPDVLAVGK